MSDLLEAIGPVLIIIITLLMYLFVVQLVNDPACAALDRSITPIIGKGLIKALALCWW